MTSPRVLALVFGLLAFSGAGTPAGAQALEGPHLALERTDSLIARAQQLVAGSDDPQAHDELGSAVRLQADARARLADGQPDDALDLTRRARVRADGAIALVRGLPDPDRVRVQLERTREVLDGTRERIEGCAMRRVRMLLRGAFDMQGRAEMSAREGRYLAALQLTLSARERAHRAQRLCKFEEDVSETAGRALRRTDDVIARARADVQGRNVEAARQALARAIEVEAEAWAHFRAERFDASLRLTQSARAFAHRAVRLAGAR